MEDVFHYEVKLFNKTTQTARNFKSMGLSAEDIAKGTGLSVKEIEKL